MAIVFNKNRMESAQKKKVLDMEMFKKLIEAIGANILVPYNESNYIVNHLRNDLGTNVTCWKD